MSTSISFETFGVETDHEGFINKIMFPKEKIISLLTKLISIKMQSPDKGSMLHPMPVRNNQKFSGSAKASNTASNHNNVLQNQTNMLMVTPSAFV